MRGLWGWAAIFAAKIQIRRKGRGALCLCDIQRIWQLNELINKIVVHQAETDENGSRIQKTEIFYRFVGKID